MKAFHSIKWQLLVWQTVLLAGVLVTLLTLHYQFQKRDLIAEVDAQLQETLLAILPVVAPPLGPEPIDMPAPGGPAGRRRPPNARTPELRRNIEEAGHSLLDSLEQKHLYAVTEGRQGLQTYGKVPESLLSDLPPLTGETLRMTRDGNRELIRSHQEMLIVIGRPMDEANAEMATLLSTLILIGGAVLVVGFAIGWLIVSRSLRPIRTISATAKTIANGKHHQRIELSDAPEELASMAVTLNESFDHLDEMIETHKRFSADASHELRTPIAVVIAQTEAALKRDRTIDEYKNILQACLRAGQRMKSMANSLLTLTRIDSQGSMLSLSSCDMNSLLSESVDAASLLSNKHPIDFQPSEKPIQLNMDHDRIHQAVMNLLTNAIQHNPDGCALHVFLNEQNGNAVVRVEDEGCGIPAEHLPHLFERFYRVDRSRSREHGGAGLGLSIVKSLIEAHGGTIDVRSHLGSGTVFTIRIPLK